jgi:REP element-mobilizing transposase RayT
LYYHFAWSTHSRIALIGRNYRPGLLKIVGEEAKKCGGWPIRHNAMPDHVHLLEGSGSLPVPDVNVWAREKCRL